MNYLKTEINNYLDFCQFQKRLDFKTLKAYRTDLNQFSQQLTSCPVQTITSNNCVR